VGASGGGVFAIDCPDSSISPIVTTDTTTSIRFREGAAPQIIENTRHSCPCKWSP